jgi:hypothetical protein
MNLRAMDLTGKTFYLAVRCERNGNHIIPLKVIDFAEDGTADVWNDFSFDATCDICKSSQRSHGYQVIVWLGPKPKKAFQTNPSFQRTLKREVRGGAR